MSSAIEGNPSGTADVPEESVWDYPRPPRLERCQHRIRVVLGGKTIADFRNALRVLETTHPATYYIPPSDVRSESLLPSSRRTLCEWKGEAHYWNLRGRTAGRRKAWMRRGAIPDQRSRSPRYATTWRFTPRELAPATSVTSGSKHRKAIFTAAGSPAMCAARSRDGPAPPGGKGLPRMADKTSCCDAG